MPRERPSQPSSRIMQLKYASLADFCWRRSLTNKLTIWNGAAVANIRNKWPTSNCVAFIYSRVMAKPPPNTHYFRTANLINIAHTQPPWLDNLSPTPTPPRHTFRWGHFLCVYFYIAHLYRIGVHANNGGPIDCVRWSRPVLLGLFLQISHIFQVPHHHTTWSNFDERQAARGRLF